MMIYYAILLSAFLFQCATPIESCSLFVTDAELRVIRVIDTASGNESFIFSGLNEYKDGPINDAGIESPYAMTSNKDGSILYVSESIYPRIRIVNLVTKTVSTLAGSVYGSNDGPAINATFASINDMVLSPDELTLYIADSSNNNIRKIDLVDEMVSTLAGNANEYGFQDGTDAKFYSPESIVSSPDGKTLYVSDLNNGCIRAVDTNTGNVSSFTPCLRRQDNYYPALLPYEIGITANGKMMYVQARQRLYAIEISSGNIEALKTKLTMTGAETDLYNPYKFAVQPDGNMIYVAESSWPKNSIRTINPNTGELGTLARYEDSEIHSLSIFCPPKLITSTVKDTTTVEKTTAVEQQTVFRTSANFPPTTNTQHQLTTSIATIKTISSVSNNSGKELAVSFLLMATCLSMTSASFF